MPTKKNKNRLFVGVYPSGAVNDENRKYHWAFLIGPKDETGDPVAGTRYQVKEIGTNQWAYDEDRVENIKSHDGLLARVLVGKIIDEDRFLKMVRAAPFTQGDPEWANNLWMQQILRKLLDEEGIFSKLEGFWLRIESFCNSYVARKTREGRYEREDGPKPTWDMLKKKEIIA